MRLANILFIILSFNLSCQQSYNLDSNYVAEGYEEILEIFEGYLQDGKEVGIQLVVYENNVKIIDLSGVVDENNITQTVSPFNFNKNSVMNIFSSGKSVGAMAVAMMVDSGLLDYQEKVAAYLPEFGNNGKGDITVADVMRHESGLANLYFFIYHLILIRGLLTKLLKMIFNPPLYWLDNQQQKSRHTPIWPSTTQCEYHSYERGFIYGELVRKVDPQGRTLGQFIKEEISDYLGVEFYVGASVEEQATFQRVPIIYYPESFKNQLLCLDTGEAVSALSISNAQSLAKIGNVLAHKGSVNGKTLFSEQTYGKNGGFFQQNDTYNKMMADPQEKSCKFGQNLNISKFTQGGMNVFDIVQQNFVVENPAGFTGWIGSGGSIFQWHDQKKISFAYIMNLNQQDHAHEYGPYIMDRFNNIWEQRNEWNSEIQSGAFFINLAYSLVIIIIIIVF